MYLALGARLAWICSCESGEGSRTGHLFKPDLPIQRLLYDTQIDNSYSIHRIIFIAVVAIALNIPKSRSGSMSEGAVLALGPSRPLEWRVLTRK